MYTIYNLHNLKILVIYINFLIYGNTFHINKLTKYFALQIFHEKSILFKWGNTPVNPFSRRLTPRIKLKVSRSGIAIARAIIMITKGRQQKNKSSNNGRHPNNNRPHSM